MTTSTISQRDSALEKANEVRVRRAELKAYIRAEDRPEARRVAALVMECPPWFAERMTAYELLDAVPFVGERLATAWLMRSGVTNVRARTLGGLTDRQRTALCELLRGTA